MLNQYINDVQTNQKQPDMAGTSLKDAIGNVKKRMVAYKLTEGDV